MGLALAACGPAGGSQRGGALPPPPPFDGASRPACSQTRTLEYVPRAADVLVLFDRSGSMNTAFGVGSRFSVEAQFLSEIVAAYQDHLRFGFAQFPAPDGCSDATEGCCARPPLIPLQYGAGDAIGYAIDQAGPPSGNTPTALALRHARAHFAAEMPPRIDPRTGGAPDRYVLLSTDGTPNCDVTGRIAGASAVLANDAACSDALDEIEALRREAGAKVIVLAVGSDLGGTADEPSCVDRLAVAGGVQRSAPTPFFPAATPGELERALQEIFGVVSPPTCFIRLDPPAADPDQVAVYFDGKQLLRGRAGGSRWWEWADARFQVIALRDEACREVGRLQVRSIEVRVGCPPCLRPDLCE